LRPQLKAGSCADPLSATSAIRLLQIALVALVLCNAGTAQQTEPSAKPPDAPSTTAQAQPEHQQLLATRSFFFPNLAVNNKPLTVKQKFTLGVTNTISGFNLIGTAMGAGISQARDTYPGYGQGAEGYFKRWGAAMGFSASSNMIGTFAVASMLHEDPRYFVQGSGKFGQGVKYAVSRVVICRMDDGSTGVNWAGILGPLGAAGIENTYLPEANRTVGTTFENYAIALGITAGTNALREFWPVIAKRLRLPSGQPAPANTPASPQSTR
jgi:hypothetical protein